MGELMDGKTKNVDERLHKLRERTQLALDQSKAIRDQLDLHEANSSPAMSGSFEDYLHLPETIQKELPPRQDAISKYLDSHGPRVFQALSRNRPAPSHQDDSAYPARIWELDFESCAFVTAGALPSMFLLSHDPIPAGSTPDFAPG